MQSSGCSSETKKTETETCLGQPRGWGLGRVEAFQASTGSRRIFLDRLTFRFAHVACGRVKLKARRALCLGKGLAPARRSKLDLSKGKECFGRSLPGSFG